MDDFRLSAADLAESVIEGEVVSPNGVPTIRPSLPMQQVKTPYVTAVAVQQPRELPDVERRLKQEAALLGPSAYYSWKVKNNSTGKEELIEGGSIGLALTAARCFGNCAIDQGDIVETTEAWFYTANFIDLETGFTTTRKFRQSRKSIVAGRMDEERKESIRFEIGQSKAIRNVVFNAVPKWLVNQALQHAKAGVRLGIQKYVNTKGMDEAVRVILDRLRTFGVSEAQVLEKVDRATTKALTIDDLVVLQGDVEQLKNGEETVGTLYGESEKGDGAKATAEPGARAEQVKEAIRSRNPKGAAGKVEYATEAQVQELVVLADSRGAEADLAKLFEHTKPDKVTAKQYEDTKKALLNRPMAQPAPEGEPKTAADASTSPGNADEAEGYATLEQIEHLFAMALQINEATDRQIHGDVAHYPEGQLPLKIYAQMDNYLRGKLTRSTEGMGLGI